jgi:5-methylcytosine-specific restriction protein A
MPTRALHNCPTPGCYHLVRESGKCDSCKRERDRERRATRSSQEVAFYHSALWQRVRKLKLGVYPLCELDCAQAGTVTAATEVDHRIPISTTEGWARRLDMDNMRSACHSCHSRRTAIDSSGWGRSA